ncbi:MAG TPA: hypothetical protein PLD37_07095 [Usitatibacteraceae bacterium]|nr:hypothetical protein [Usitatibacteraceae bacterium]
MIRFILAAMFLAALPARAAEPLKLVAVQARLFFQHSGTLSKPLDDSTILHNVIIGEGGVPEPSRSLLATAIVEGKPGSYDEKWRVDFTATDRETGKVIARFAKDVGVLSDKGRYHVPFWLPETGCIPLVITARIRGARAEAKRVVPFRCGE